MVEIFEETFPKFCPNVQMRTDAVAMWYWSKDAKRRERSAELVPWPLPADVYGLAVKAALPVDVRTKKRAKIPEGGDERARDAAAAWWRTGRLTLSKTDAQIVDFRPEAFQATVTKHARILEAVRKHEHWEQNAA
jgi:hypothetical protein